MRTLSSKETLLVIGGDGEELQSLACQTAAGALTVLTGATYGATAGGVAGVGAITGVPICETVATAVGEAIVATGFSMLDGFNELIIDVGDSFGAMADTLNRGTL